MQELIIAALGFFAGWVLRRANDDARIEKRRKGP